MLRRGISILRLTVSDGARPTTDDLTRAAIRTLRRWWPGARDQHAVDLIEVMVHGCMGGISDLVDDMHQGHARIDSSCGNGSFNSGPSKTADLAQCLVVSAHGARALTCYPVGDRPRSAQIHTRQHREAEAPERRTPESP